MAHKDIVRIIDILISLPIVDKEERIKLGDKQRSSIREVLLKNVQNVGEYLEKNEGLVYIKEGLESIHLEFLNGQSSARILFVENCLKLLSFLKETLIRERESDTSTALTDILSIQERKIVSSCVQFIFGLGVIPNLLPGIGISARKNVDYFDVTKDDEEFNSLFDKQKQLMQCVIILLDCTQYKTLSELIVVHMSDILASLMQLSNLPISLFPESSKTELCKYLPRWKEECIKRLYNFMRVVDQLSLIKELLVLKGCCQVSTPSWYVKLCSVLLSKQLCRPNGVRCVICAVLNIEWSPKININENNFDWKKCELIAKLIVQSRLPKRSDETYFSFVGPQILQLLRIRDADGRNPFLKVVVTIFKLASELHCEQAGKFLWTPLLQPLLKCTQELDTASPNDKGAVIVEESILTQTIEDLYELYVLTNNLKKVSFEFLRPVFGIMFHLLLSSNSTISHLRKELQAIIAEYIAHSDQIYAAKYMKELLLNEHGTQGFLSWNASLVPENGLDGGIQIVYNTSDDNLVCLDTIGNKTNAIVELLHALKKNECVSNFFLLLLEEFTAIQSQLLLSKTTKRSDDRGLLLEIEENVSQNHFLIKKTFLLVNLLEALLEDSTLQDYVLQNKTASLQFLKFTFARAAEQIEEVNDCRLVIETLSLAMTLTMLLLSKTLTSNEKTQMKTLVPSLEKLSKHHGEEYVRQMAEELRIAILTEGVVMPDDKTQKLNEMSEFQKAMCEIKDPFLPVQGHALISLKRLIDERDEETMLHQEELLELFQTNLDHEDTYIYQSSILGLAALCYHYPDLVVSCLTTEYADYEKKKSKNSEIRLKLGEVLVKVTRDLGEILPKYKEDFLRAFLSGCKDRDSQVRASSLSNLGEVCKGLKFSLGSCLHEILYCVESLLKTDNALEVKQACVLFITLIIRGLGEDIFQVMETTILNLYRSIKDVCNVEKDERILRHARIALEELKIVVTKYLFPEPAIKPIRIK